MLQRVLTKEKIDRQLSGQSCTTTSFLKIGDDHHSNKTVSFNMHIPIREQLESLISMVYNMSIHKEDSNRPFKPQIHQKKRRGQNRQHFGDRNRSYSRDKDKMLDLTIGDNHKTDVYNMDMTVAEEVIDTKIMTIEMTVEIEGDKTLEKTSALTDMTIGIGVEQAKEVWYKGEMTAEDMIVQIQT